MLTIYKVLGQVNPPAAQATPLYTVPANTAAVISTITVCNQTGAPATFRIAVRPANEALSAKHYIAYDAVVNQNDMVAFTLGITLAATDVITVYSSTATVSFSIFGSELS